MPGASPYGDRLSRYGLALCLLVQLSLLLAAPGLLPIWGDEQFTLTAAQKPFKQVLDAISAEQNNPPLHTLLLHFWLLIPWPVGAIEAARWLSAILALAATVAIDRLWLRKLAAAPRLCFLSLWAVSPCLVLYARIARSDSLQILVFALAFRAAEGLLAEAAARKRVVLFSAAAALLLYTHYLPGVALVGAVTALLGWQALRGRRTAALSALSVVILVSALYIPWVGRLAPAMGRMLSPAPPALAAGYVTSVLLRPGYLGFSFLFGETPPLWVLAGAALLAPGVAWVAWRGLRERREWWWPLGLVTAASYAGASRWVSFVFTPGRLLFLLPFVLVVVVVGIHRSRRAGLAVWAGLVILSLGSLSSYFRRADFLNKAYLLPYDEIASLIRDGGGGRALLVADACNTDPFPLMARVGRGVPVVLVTRASTAEGLQEQIAAAQPDVIWMFANTHDISPGNLNQRMETELSRGRTVRRRLFVPYSARDALFIRLMKWGETPTHFVQLLEIAGPAPGAGPK